MKNALFLAACIFISSTTVACSAEKEPDTHLSDPAFCADVNAIWKQCQTIKMNCEVALKDARQELVTKISACPISANMDMMPPSGKFPELGHIPCCVFPIIGNTP